MRGSFPSKTTGNYQHMVDNLYGARTPTKFQVNYQCNKENGSDNYPYFLTVNKSHITWRGRKVYKHIFIFDLAYLQCTGATVIKKAVLPGRGSQCTKRAEPRVFPTRVGARCSIFVRRADLRTRLWPCKNEEKTN